MPVETMTVKEHARRVIENLPEDATWEDVEYAVYVCKKIAAGLADLDAGRTYTTEEVKQRLGLA